MKQQILKPHRNYLLQPRHAHESDPDNRGDVDFTGETSLTKQADADACDINNIMAKYTQTGFLPEGTREALYGDFSGSETFQEAMHIVAQANSQFMALPAEIRARFTNDPARFLEFVENPANGDELVKMGLASYPEAQLPPQAPQKSKKQNPAPQPTQEND